VKEEKIELEPFAPALLPGLPPGPPAPTVIEYGVETGKEAIVPVKNPPAPPPPAAPFPAPPPPPPPAITK